MQSLDDPQFAQVILAHVSDAIIAIDRDERITYLNAAAEKQYGRPAAEAVGKPLRDLYTYRWLRDTDEAAARALLASSGVWRGENIHVRPDGVSYHVESTVTARQSSDGEFDGAIAIIRDIGALRKSEAHLRLLIESVTDYAIFTTDTEGRIDSWNTGACRIFGFAAPDILGRSSAVLFTPEDRAAGAHLREMEVARDKGCAEDERYHCRKDGSRFYASGTLTPLRDPGGELRGFVKVARDLTARKESETALQRAHDDLGRRVAERTRELEQANATLAHELTVRREAEERVRQLWSRVISAQEDERRRIARDLHDHLGQQMTALHLKLQTLRRARPDDAVLQQNVADADAYVSQIETDLDFFTWELRPAALYDLGLVPALTDFVTAFAKNYGIPATFETLGVISHRLLPQIEINLYRILQEAMNNVYKHAQATRIDVFLQQRGDNVVLTVTDDGRGFDAEVVTGGDGNQGLGLLGMRERAALIGGTIEFESSKQGTTVIVCVPALFAPPRR
jgi:PAS domain S-box-containing protein